MSLRFLILIALSAALVGCGGGSDNNPPPSAPVTAAPSNLSYSAPQPLVVAQPMSAMSPTVTGSVTSYTVSPALPAGLSIDASSGAISGTPTAASPPTTYTVTASNSSGSTTASVSIRVNDVAPTISYTRDTYKFATGAQIAELQPTSTAGAVTNWSVNPALPAGMTFDTTDGSIGGTPTAVSAAAPYVVTAANSGGQVTVSLTISVESGVLLDLGHISSIQAIAYDGVRVLSQDMVGNWALWNSQTGAKVAAGGNMVDCRLWVPCVDPHIALAGPTAVIRTVNGFEIRSSATGDLLASFAADVSWWNLATDGSYLAAGSGTALTAWSPAGAVLFSRPGDYSNALAFADVGVVRIGRGPLGNVIESATVPAGALVTRPIPQGQFHAWFTDGERFIANVSNNIWIYSKTLEEQDSAALTTIENLTGQGQWYWTATPSPSDRVDVFEVGEAGAVTTSFTAQPQRVKVSSPTTMTILTSDQAKIVDFSGATVAITDHALPVSASDIAVAPGGEWIVGNGGGVLADVTGTPGTTRYFSYGQVLSIAGGSERFALATSFGKVWYFNAQTRQLEGELEASSNTLALSADGAVLAVGQIENFGDRTLQIVSLPSETEINRWTYSPGVLPTMYTFWLSGSGGVVGRSLNLWFSPSQAEDRWEVTTATGSPLWAANFYRSERSTSYLPGNDMPIRLSFDGSQIAVPDAPGRNKDAVSSKVYRSSDGSLLTTLPGWAVGWLDDNRLLMNEYDPSFYHYPLYKSAAVRDTSGQTLATPALPVEIYDFQLLSPSTIYSPGHNTIFSVDNGAALWTSSNEGGGGAVAGDYVVFRSGATIRMEPYR